MSDCIRPQPKLSTVAFHVTWQMFEIVNLFCLYIHVYIYIYALALAKKRAARYASSSVPNVAVQF